MRITPTTFTTRNYQFIQDDTDFVKVHTRFDLLNV